MHVTRLALSNFRNYRHLEFDLCGGHHLFYGDNAQGKSNLLEAIYFVATTRSPRTANDRELMAWSMDRAGLDATTVHVEVRRRDGPLDLEIAMQAAEATGTGYGPHTGSTPAVRKRIRVNGIGRRAADAIGHLVVVWFSPQDVDLVTGAPSLRRRYLDVAISQVDQRYIRSLQRYNRILLQRNHLLRLIREGRSQRDEMNFWDAELTIAGAYVLLRRWEITADLDSLAREAHLDMSEGAERLGLSYVGTVDADVTSGMQLGERLALVQELFQAKLHEKRERELLQGATLVGPHRDDMRFLANDQDLSAYGSRGQQRTAALSLKLAELRLLEREAGEPPVLLLDDAFSELDGRRRRQLLLAVENAEQVFLTATDPDRLEDGFMERWVRHRVSEGQVEEG